MTDHPLRHFDDRARQNLRLDPQILAQIDAARGRRPGNVSRNTWIAEAILEKIEREQDRRGITELGERRA